ncbi:hypothetical protein F4801DRAFT_580772 [Xylaria longipes]|nr:hypothetical protein F4801DRAFT_580772 [Xylaria longipes]
MANRIKMPEFPNSLSQVDILLFENFKALAYMLAENAAAIERLEHSVARLGEELDEFQEHIANEAEARAASRTATPQLGPPFEPSTQMRMREITQSPDADQVEIQFDLPALPPQSPMYRPSTPPPRESWEGFYSATSTPSKRKASENSQLNSMRRFRQSMLSRQGCIPFSFDSAAQRQRPPQGTTRSSPTPWDRGCDVDFGSQHSWSYRQPNSTHWSLNDPGYAPKRMRDEWHSERQFYRSPTPETSFRLSPKPLGTDPPKKTPVKETRNGLPPFEKLTKETNEILDRKAKDNELNRMAEEDDEQSSDMTM